jgi:O-antigen biosynthesis protein
MGGRICIVTPDIVGPMKNGGIGTHCYWLARFLAKSGYAVSVLYTGPFQFGTYKEVQVFYAKDKIEFFSLSEIPKPKYQYYGIEYQGEVSERVYHFLKDRSFDVIHFQDWQGNSFASIQAKETGVAFEWTELVVGVHSPSLWEREGMQIWAASPITECRLDYMEKYAIEHADRVWSPSQAMLDWLASKRIVPKNKARIIRYLIHFDNLVPQTLPGNVAKDISHLVFFGRLETRKGFELFVNAINKLLKFHPVHDIKRITFLGKIGKVQNNANALYYLKQTAEDWKTHGIESKVIDNFDAFQAIRYIQKTGAIAIIPSLLDNYPYTVLECIENRIPCLASSVGGIPEMIHAECTFKPTVDSLREALQERRTRIEKMGSTYSNEQVQQDWLSYSAELIAGQEKIVHSESTPRVSICVAYYNYGKYLPQLLDSLKKNDYRNFEVIVVNDGSTDSSSIQVFKQQEQQFSHYGWKFISQENQGIGATRNFAASQAEGEYLIFMDADNVATPRMISTFVRAIQKRGADALTCMATVFRGDGYPDSKTEVFYLYRPLGPVLEMAMLENVFGDANSIMTKKAFDAIGGFGTDRSTSYEDWELFASLVLEGFTLDVIPERLFYYRHQGQGFSRITSPVENQKRVLNAFYRHSNKINFNGIMQNILVPLFYAKQPKSELREV